jgi:hypothetical protein
MREYGTRARDALLARQAAGRKDPNWYVQMINLAGSQSWPRDRFLELIHQATAAFPSSYQIYFTAAIYMTPRWGGSVHDVVRFADYAVTQTQKKEGQSLYARILWSVADYLDANLAGPEVDWQRLSAGFLDIIKRYPDDWNKNSYAKFACDAQDAKAARRALSLMAGNIEPEAWPDRATYLRCRQFAGMDAAR